MNYKTLDKISVFLNFGREKYLLGSLAKKNKQIWFEYDSEFIRTGLEISSEAEKLKKRYQC
jgi:hypothetical protein